MTRFPRRAAVLLAAVSLAALAGCSAAQDAAQNAADQASAAASAKASELAESAKTQATDAVKKAAAAAAKQAICAAVSDGRVSDADVEAVRKAVEAGADAGVPPQVLSAAKAVVSAGTGATDAQVARVKAAACA